MNDAIIIKGLGDVYRSNVDGGLKITIELDEHQDVRFHEGFPRWKGTLVAVARLADDTDEHDSLA